MADIYPLGMSEFVAFDIETTGLDGNSCEIIEIAAVLVMGGEIAKQFSTLVRPKGKIPINIQHITGISPDMVEDAPDEPEALGQFIEFIGDSPIIAHNIEFDIGFIRARLMAWELDNIFNPLYDSLSMSRVLYPRLVNHKLDTLARFFGIKNPSAHRALADAMTLAGITGFLWQRWLALPIPIVEQIAHLLRYSAMPGMADLSRAARDIRPKVDVAEPEGNTEYLIDLSNEIGKKSPGRAQFDRTDVRRMLSETGPLPQFLNNYAEREIQIEMAGKITDAFKNGQFLLAEAGTGTGKSFAYLIPSIFFARAENKKVVISTKTKNLQEQLFFKDIPVLFRAMGRDFKAVLLKGRGNYVCRFRFERFMADPDRLSFTESDAFAAMVVWLWETDSGDVVENTTFSAGPNRFLWGRLISDGKSCAGRRCPFHDECFVTRVRKASAEADVVVINHALLFSDVQAGAILGEYEYVVIDEAHALEKAAADHFSDQVNIWRFRGPSEQLFTNYPKDGGALYDIINRFEDVIGPSGNMRDRMNDIKDATEKLRDKAEYTFNRLSALMERQYHWKSKPYSVRERYDAYNAVYTQAKPFFEELSGDILEIVDQLEVFLGEVPDDDDMLHRFSGDARSAMDRFSDLASSLTVLLSPEEQHERVLWMESPTRNDRDDSSLCFAPLDIDELVHRYLLEPRSSIIMTSATLSIAGNFSYIEKRLGFDLVEPGRVENFIMDSPFDYQSQLRFIVPMWMEMPNSPGFNNSVGHIVREMSLKLRRGTLGLFTSYAMLKDVYNQVAPDLEGEGISVLAQSLTGPRSALTRAFREDPESVLLGTESFWEGVDVPGESLEILLLTKLPFAVPSDPYVAAQMERIKENGGNAFMDYQVPEAVIRFRQGLGRLIRSESDYGVLIVPDKRLVMKRYGQLFVNSAPVPLIRVASMKDLLRVLTDHLA